LLRGSVGAIDAAPGVNSPKQYVPKPAFNGLATTSSKTNYWLLSKAGWEKTGIAIGGTVAAATAYFSIRGLRSFFRRPEETEHPVRQATEARGVGSSRSSQPSARVYPGGVRLSNTPWATAGVGMGGGVQLPYSGAPMATRTTTPQGFVPPVQPTGVGQPTGSGVRF